MQLHVRAPLEQALAGHGCAACAVAAAAFFEGECRPPASDEGGGGGDGAAAQMAPLFLELVTAWPIGYRLEEKCSALGSFLGGGGAFHAMCAHHGCSDD